MEAENIGSESNTGTPDRRELRRSASYPGITVLKAYEFAAKINDQFSTVAEVKREEIATALGIGAGSIVREIAACVQYGLLNKNTSEGKYKLSKRFEDIFRPESEKDKKLNLIAAFGSPNLFQELITKFDNNIIPNELSNTLIKHHGITEAASKAAAETFLESGKEVGVISENRVLKYSITNSTVSKTQYAEILDSSPGGVEMSEQNESQNSWLPIKLDKKYNEGKKLINIPIHLTNSKAAVFCYPDDISENDVKIVEHQLAGILLRISLENAEKKNKMGET